MVVGLEDMLDPIFEYKFLYLGLTQWPNHLISVGRPNYL